jgi:hypothetical protein
MKRAGILFFIVHEVPIMMIPWPAILEMDPVSMDTRKSMVNFSNRFISRFQPELKIGSYLPDSINFRFFEDPIRAL